MKKDLSKVMRTPDGKFKGIVYRYKLLTPGADYGKEYVGKTDNQAQRRRQWNNPKNKRYGGSKITEARKTWGVVDWDYAVLEELICDTYEELYVELSKLEEKYIREHDSVENGFNGSYGNGNLGMTFKWKDTSNHRAYQTEETKAKISERLRGREVSEETRKKISAGNTGKVRTDEMNQAQSERMKLADHTALQEGSARWRAENESWWKTHPIPEGAKAKMKTYHQAHGTAVLALFPDGSTQEYPTMLDAAKGASIYAGYKINAGSVSNCIKNGGTTRAGIKFNKL